MFPEKVAEELSRLTLITQLKSRRIIRLATCHPADGYCVPTRGGFMVLLNPSPKTETLPFVFGHELGHTYFYTNDEFPRRIQWGSSAEEMWCENFSKEWLKNLALDDRCLLELILNEVKKIRPEEIEKYVNIY